MKTFSISLIIIALATLSSVYIVGTDKIKLKKSTETLYFIGATIAVFSYVSMP